VKNFIKREEFNIMARELDYFKKEVGRLCTREELMTRLNVFNSELNEKLHDRPTISYFKKVLSVYDTKIELFNGLLNEQMEKLDTT
jgi:hypothetical protein